jgi:hypothetical protein
VRRKLKESQRGKLQHLQVQNGQEEYMTEPKKQEVELKHLQKSKQEGGRTETVKQENCYSELYVKCLFLAANISMYIKNY